MKKLIKQFILISILAFLTASCSKESKKDVESEKYVCILNPTQGNNVNGKLSIWQKGSDLFIQGEITGLTPGKHGIHIHEKGDCSAPDASSAGGHFNPTSKQHGIMGKDSHEGDLENVIADDKGIAKVDLKLDASYWMLTGPNSIAGRSIVVHAAEDDLKTQPSGNSGARVACGIIEKAK